MINSKVMALMKYRFHMVTSDEWFGLGFFILGAVVAAVLGLSIISVGIILWYFPTFFLYNGMEEEDRKITKLQLSLPVSRRQNINARFLTFVLANVLAVLVGYGLHLLTDFFLELGLLARLGINLGELTWWLAEAPFYPIIAFGLAFNFINAGLYYALSYTLFKHTGRPPGWFAIIFTLVINFIVALVPEVSINVLGTTALVVSAVILTICYFVTIQAFEKIDFC